MATEPFTPPRRSWPKKFAAAFRGIALGMRGQSSFAIHIPVAALVVIAGAYWRVTVTEWCLLALSITAVLAAEIFNCVLETLAKALDDRPNPHLAAGLDIASGAVLLTAIGAAIIGAVIFVPRLLALVGWV